MRQQNKVDDIIFDRLDQITYEKYSESETREYIDKMVILLYKYMNKDIGRGGKAANFCKNYRRVAAQNYPHLIRKWQFVSDILVSTMEAYRD